PQEQGVERERRERKPREEPLVAEQLDQLHLPLADLHLRDPTAAGVRQSCHRRFKGRESRREKAAGERTAMRAEQFRFDGKRALVVGGATGMGAAAARLAAELGAELTVLDVVDVEYPTSRSLRVDLADKASVDAVLGELDGTFDVVFSCAG